MTCEEIYVKTALAKSRLEGTDFALNPYVGCEHGCIYCYGPYVVGRDVGSWTQKISVKRNLATVLAREIPAKRGVITIGTVTDAYQPAEKKYKITRTCLEVLARKHASIRILTKSSLVARDIDILSRFTDLHIGVTVTTLDSDLRKIIEPNSAPTDKRLHTLANIKEACEQCLAYLFIGPIIPGAMTTSELAYLLELSENSGFSYIIFDKLRLRGDIYERISTAMKRAGLTMPSKASLFAYYSDIKRRFVRISKKHGVKIFFEF